MKANLAPRCPSFTRPKPSVAKWLGALLRASFALCLVIHSANGGTWTSVTNTAPGQIQLMLLLTDGTVMCSDSGTTSNWFKLTPDSKGNYANGTWTNLAPMGFTRRYYSSQVLQNGKVMIAGAEYGTGAATTELYDPISNTWTQVTVPAGLVCICPQGDGTGGAFRDAGSILLPDGKMMSAPVFPATNNSTVIYDPVANTWSAGTITLGSQNEASWVKLPDDSILTIDLQSPAPQSFAAERFIPSLNAWISDSNAPVALYDVGAEIGGALLLPDGRAMFFGGNTNTAFYTPSGNTNRGTWAAGPVLPNGQACPDAPAAMLVNGNALLATSPFNATSSYPANVSFYEYNTVSNTFARQSNPTGGLVDSSISVYQTAFLCLPDGNILYSHWTSNLYVYTPSGPIITQGKPTIRSVSLNVDGSLHLTGTKFNGLSMGATYGDDLQMDSNYPLVRFIDADGNVRYGRTYNWSSTGVATGTNIVSTDCTMPAGASFQDTIQVVANGNASDGVPALSLSVALETPTLPWINGGTTNWRNVNTVTHDGVDAAQSGSITDNQNSYMEATLTGPGTLSFWWKVSSETNFDYLRFAMDGNDSNSISGNVDWQLITMAVPAGSHVLRFTYSKDVSLSVGSDAGWVDQVNFAPSLPVALDTPSLTWTTGGNVVWEGEIATTHDGVDAAQSGDINDFQTNYIETTVSGSGAVSFWWKVSSETNYDYLRFYLDGVEQAGAPGISGEVPWQQRTVVIPPIPAGSHTLRWAYSKDVSLSVGADAGWVDQVVFISGEVTVANDSGPGSLRQTIAALPTGATILFATNLSGSTIVLTNGRLLLDKNLTIDASALPGGITLSGNGASRAFYIPPGVTNTLNNLTITNCSPGEQPLPGYGGAIFLAGTLRLTNCILANNFADVAGGALLVQSTAAAVINNCTFLQNSSVYGGAIQAEGSLTANNSTFWRNTGTNSGGAINVGFTPSIALNFCTMSGNSSPVGSGLNLTANAALTTIYNSIIAGNTGAGANIAGAFTSTGVNLTTGNPLLAPLGNYGGRTPTMPPLSGSPAIDAAAATAFATDQRGFPRVVGAAPDIGAVESGNAVPNFTPVVTINDDVINAIGAGGVSLRAAVAFATNNSTITFSNNLSGQTIVLTNGQIGLNRNVTIDGSTLPNGVAISGSNHTRIFEVMSGSVTLNTLTLTNGNALFSTGLGGGVLVDSNATLIVNNCSILGNVANYGGGILGDYATLVLNNSTLFGNSAAAFGALGGAIYNFEGTLAMTNCTVVGNSASNSASYAGGVRSTAGTVLFNTIICSNDAPNLPNLFAPSFSGTNNLIDGSPLLASLGNYGGPTPTLPPLPGSPVINAGGPTSLATDQRGYARTSGPAADIGAVEVVAIVSSLTDDNANTSLRRIILGSSPGQTNTFDLALSGGTIVLTNGQIDLNRNLTLDGSALPGGITISGNNFIHISRLFEVTSGAATLNSLTLTNGNALFSTGLGGGVLVDSNATLIVNNCSLLGNVANYGGGILGSYATLVLNNSTVFGNAAVALGALGGGIYNFEGTLAMTNCTVVGNTASNSASSAGGVRSTVGTVLFNTIICSNVAPSLPNLFAPSFSGSNNLIDGSPQLASLGNYGGPVPTMPPLPGSPVIDAGNDSAASLFATDQRGLPRLSGLHVDIGAAEFQTTLITTTNPPTLINLTRLGNGAFQFGFTNIPGASFTVLTATNVVLPLTNWTVLGAPTEVPPGTYQFTDLQATNIATCFYRVRSP